MPTLGECAEVLQGIAAGRRSAARPGPWELAVIDSSDITDDRLATPRDDLRRLSVAQTSWTEKRLLRPLDLLVTARSQRVKIALVPGDVARTVAASTLLVVRAADPGSGLAHYLWYYLTSRRGRAELEGRITRGMTIPTLSARALAGLPVPVPERRRLATFPGLVEAAGDADRAALDAARIRRDTIRDAVIGRLAANAR